MSSKSSKGAAAPTKSDVSNDPIREFYTDHPYPPPLDNLDRAREMWEDENVHRAEFHLLWPNKEYRADFDVLVAGCGTWQAAKFALCHPGARVTAIDVSTTSLEHTEGHKQKYDLTNLETRLLSIESVAELDQQFDLIVCTGVLHHLVDPDAGLRALRSVLKPDGAMYLMLYAPYGRAGIYMIQDYCRRLGIEPSKEEVNDLKAMVSRLPQHHPLLLTLRGDRKPMDDYTVTDALLNPRERAYSVPELLDFLQRNDMTFGRWYWQAAYLPECGSFAETPHAKKLAALSEDEQYAAMELWRGLMTVHSLVAHRNDMNGGAKVSFEDESYLQYVPVRLPWTLCVEEQIPPGAKGVLVNQTHVFRDLFMILDEETKKMFDAIDGRRTVAEIVGSVEGASPRAREFFEKLWQYDQVVYKI